MQSDPAGGADGQTSDHSQESSPPLARQSPLPIPIPVSAASIFEGRLHPLTIVFGLLKAARAIIPAASVLLFGNKIYGFILLSMIIASTVATSLARYFSFRYRIEGSELITQHGILERKQRSIPLERIQEIRVEQGILHRVFDVVDAKVETGGGEGAEASLSVLSRAEVERLRRAVFERAAILRAGAESSDHGVGASIPAPPEQILIRRLGLKDLILSGLTTNHLLSALALAGALWHFAEDMIPHSFYRRAGGIVYRESSRLLTQGRATTIAVAIVVALAVILLGAIFSMAGAIIRFYGFTFSRSGEDLYRRYGLFTKRASSLPRHRIQVLKIEEKLFRRLFGLATLRADTSGSHRERKDDNTGHDVLLPIARRNEVDDLLKTFFPDFDAGETEWRRVSQLAIRRGLIKGAIVCGLFAAIFLTLNWRVSSLWPFALAPLIYFISVANYRNLAYRFSDRYFCARRGWAGRSTHIVPINKIQAVEIHQSPFDRRLGLATLRVDTAGQAYTGGGPHIGNLPVEEARAIASALAQKASTTRYFWRTISSTKINQSS
jgi:putative membrane protein